MRACRLLLALVALFLPAAGFGALAAAAEQHLAQAWVVESDRARYPEELMPTLRGLPDDWSAWRGDASGPVWYRLRFATPAANELTAVYIGRVCSRYMLFLNGELLQRAGDAGAQLCNRPQLVNLPNALLSRGVNRLDLRVEGEPLARVAARLHSGGLSDLTVGPRDRLARRHARETALRVDAPQAVSATLALMGGFMFVLGWRHRSESHLAYFGALCVGWGLVELRRWLPELPWSPQVAEFLQAALLAFVTLAAVQFLLRHARHRSPWIGRGLALQCALMPASLVVVGAQHLHAAVMAWVLLFALQIGAVAVLHLRLRRRMFGHWPVPAMALLAVASMALAVELVARHWALPPTLVHGGRLLVPLSMLIVGLRLVQLHGKALQAAEAGRAQLETRVREATAEIERNFHQLAELRVEQVTERERKRIAADLHDDLGAKLLTIVHTSDDARISTLAREALEEMRLSVRGLTGKAVRLGDALGDWRAELMSRLTQSGIEGEWTSPDDLPQTLSARAYVQTTRILREATSNIIKHSGASRCTFVCSIADGDLQLSIQDNGNGIPMELDGRLDRGHGMSSMKHRAKQMQGQCLVESGPGYGTVIRLTLPLEGATEPAP